MIYSDCKIANLQIWDWESVKPCGEELDTTENSFSQNKYLHSKIISFEFAG